MRIEIYGNGGVATAYQNQLENLYDGINDTIEALQKAKNEIANVNGVWNTNLELAHSSINNRIRAEEVKKGNVQKLQQKSERFFENTVKTDKQVAEVIKQNEKKFYEKHPHLKPVGIDPESVWNWIVEKWEGLCDGVEKVWNGIVDFVKEHAVELIVGVVTLAIAAVLTVLSGGALLPLLVGVLEGMLISGLFSAAIVAFTGGDILDAFFDGLAEGFMWGGIFALAASIVNVIKGFITGTSKISVVDDVVDDAVNSTNACSGKKFKEVFELADNYTLSDDVFNNHILERHGPNSTYRQKSHFNLDFDIKKGIDSTLKGDNVIVQSNTAGREGYIFKQTFDNAIGTKSNGQLLYTLKVVIDESGNVITAFPIK